MIKRILSVIVLLFLFLVGCSNTTESESPRQIEQTKQESDKEAKWYNPSEKTMKEFYTKYYEELSLSQQVEFETFELYDKKEMDELLKTLAESSFDNLIKESKTKNGYSHWIIRENNNYFSDSPNMLKKVFSMKPDEISTVLIDYTTTRDKTQRAHYNIVRCISTTPKKYLSYEALKDKIFSILILCNPEINYDIIEPSIETIANPADIKETYKWIKYNDSHWCGNCAQSRERNKVENLYQCFDKLGDYRRAMRYWFKLKYFTESYKIKDEELNKEIYNNIDAERILRGSLITVSKADFNWFSSRQAIDACGLFPSEYMFDRLIEISQIGDDMEKHDAIRVLGKLSEQLPPGIGRMSFSSLDSKAWGEIKAVNLLPATRQKIRECIINSANDRDDMVRKSVAEALGFIGDEGVIPVLNRMLVNEPDSKYYTEVIAEIRSALKACKENIKAYKDGNSIEEK